MATLLTETVEPFPSYEEVPEQEKMAQICLIYDDPERFGAAALICDYADMQPRSKHDGVAFLSLSAIEKQICGEIWSLVSAALVMFFALFYSFRSSKHSRMASKTSVEAWMRQPQQTR